MNDHYGYTRDNHCGFCGSHFGTPHQGVCPTGLAECYYAHQHRHEAAWHSMITMADVRKSLAATMTFDARDWSANPRDAWIYGIIQGWDYIMPEVAALHRWDPVTQARLKELHRIFMANT